MTKPDAHPDWNELAALADHGTAQASPELMAHLAVCPACMVAYSDAVQTRDAELAGGIVPEQLPVPSFASRKIIHLPRRWAPMAVGAGGMVAAAVLLVVLFSGNPATFGPGDPRSDLQTRLSELSSVGPIYPGVGELPADSGTRYRSSGTPSGTGADALLIPWAERFAADPADTDAAYWLSAGYLAAGRVQFAEDVLHRALQREPGATGLQHLDVIAAYRLNELDRAEAALRRILAQRPNDELALFNLSLIQTETGRFDQARPVLERLAEGDADPALQDRARQLLAQMAE